MLSSNEPTTKKQKHHKVINIIDVSEVISLIKDPAIRICYENNISPIIDVLKQRGVDIDAILNCFLGESDLAVINEMLTITNDLIRSNCDMEFLVDKLNILKFLLNRNLIVSYIDRLEADLQQYVAQLPDDKHLPMREDGKYILPPGNMRKKILSGYLTQWAQSNGFQRKAKILGSINETDFLALVSSGTFFKDNGAALLSINHGIWSHMLQWYFIFSHHQSTQFLYHKPIDVYLNFGKLDQGYFWKEFIDTYRMDDFTCPEYLTNVLLNPININKWPILSETTRRQKVKLDITASIKNKQNSFAQNAVIFQALKPSN